MISPVTELMKELAIKSGVAVVGVSETEPFNQDYWTWMNNELVAVKTALIKK